MSVFPNWEKYAVRQKREKTGCIPTGYEMILHAKGFSQTDIDYKTFQDVFDFDKDLQPRQEAQNGFYSVAKAIKECYPNIIFKDSVFDKGIDKLKFIEENLNRKQPVLVSITIEGLHYISTKGRLFLAILDLFRGGTCGDDVCGTYEFYCLEDCGKFVVKNGFFGGNHILRIYICVLLFSPMVISALKITRLISIVWIWWLLQMAAAGTVKN